MTVRAMVMAAGAGTRLRPLTHEIPKPMVPVANRPVLEYTIENLKRHGIKEMVLNLHSHPEMIRKYFGDGRAWGVKIHYSFEPRLLGTAGGVKKVESFLNRGTFLVLSGDGLTNINLTSLLAFHRRHKSVASMALKSVDSRFDYGVTLTKPDGRISKFIEKPLWSDVFSSEVNTGLYVFEPESLKAIPKASFYDFGKQFWPKLLKKRARIYGYKTKDYWCDVGNLHEYRRAQRDILDGQMDIPMPGRQIRPGVWVDEGTTIEHGVKLEAPCLIGKNGHIAKGSLIGAYTVIGHRAKIGAGSKLRNCILWDDVQVGKHVKLENCILGHGTKVTESISVYEGAVITITA